MFIYACYSFTTVNCVVCVIIDIIEGMRYWMNSLGVSIRFIEEMNDGLVLLKLLDTICKGVVPWNKVNMKPPNAFKKIENCSLVRIYLLIVDSIRYITDI